MADMKQAMKWLVLGKKIRLPHWDQGSYIHKLEDNIVSNEGVQWKWFEFVYYRGDLLMLLVCDGYQ